MTEHLALLKGLSGMAEDPKIPKVFISYSHENREHKIWVYDLAKKLRENGVDVIFDQWDLGPGDDVPKFMERSLTEANRVLMICTEKYVHKADEGVGGVGYEAMIVTGELVNDLGTTKFIPVIRQKNSHDPSLPKSVSTRKFVDLRDEATFDENFEELLRELHETPLSDKPPLGKNPFVKVSSILEVGKEEVSEERLKLVRDFDDVQQIFSIAQDAAQRGDLLRWRNLVRETRNYTTESLLNWRISIEEGGGSSSENQNDRIENGLSIHGPLIGIALAGLASGNHKFANQFSLLEDILFPNNWNWSGSVAHANLPFGGGFIYQALHGAMSLFSQQLYGAIKFVRVPLDSPFGAQMGAVWQVHKLIGWPDSYGGNSKVAWEGLISLPDKWPWLNSVFGEKDEFLSSLVAYYMALNVNEYCCLLKDGEEEKLENLTRQGRLGLEVPLHFLGLEDGIERRAYRLLTEDMNQVKDIWISIGISNEKFVQFWDKWLLLCGSWLDSEFSFWHKKIGHEKLGKEIGV